MEKNQLIISYTGVIEFITNTKEETNKKGDPYSIRSFGVKLNDTNEKYPVTLVFDLLGNPKKMDRINILNSFSVGEDVVVKFAISSNAYTDKKGENRYFLNLNLINLERGGANQDNSGITMGNPPEEDDLPF